MTFPKPVRPTGPDAPGVRPSGSINAPRLRSTVGGGLMMFAFSGTLVILGLLVPSGIERFHTTVSAYLIQISILGLIGALMMPVIGRVANRYGVRRPLIIGSLWSVGCILAVSFATELWQMYLFTALWALLWSFTSVVPVTILVNTWWNQHPRRGLVLGLVMSGAALGGVVWGAVMPTIIKAFGWSGGVRTAAISVFVCMTLTGFFLVRNPPAIVRDKTSSRAKQSLRAAGLLAPVLLLLLGAGMLSLEAGLISTLPSLLVSKGMDLAAAGLLVSYFAVIQVGLKPLGGAIYDRWGAVVAALVLIAGYAIGFGGLAVFTGLVPLLLVLPFAALALTNHLVLLPMFTASIVEGERFGSTYGTVMMVYYVCSSLSIPLWGLGFDLTRSYTPSLLGGLVAGLIAVAIIFWSVKLAAKRKTGNAPTAASEEQLDPAVS